MDIATECDNGSTSGASASHEDMLKCYLCRGPFDNTRKSRFEKRLVDKFLSEIGLADRIDSAVASTPGDRWIGKPTTLNVRTNQCTLTLFDVDR